MKTTLLLVVLYFCFFCSFVSSLPPKQKSLNGKTFDKNRKIDNNIEIANLPSEKIIIQNYPVTRPLKRMNHLLSKRLNPLYRSCPWCYVHGNLKKTKVLKYKLRRNRITRNNRILNNNRRNKIFRRFNYNQDDHLTMHFDNQEDITGNSMTKEKIMLEFERMDKNAKQYASGYLESKNIQWLKYVLLSSKNLFEMDMDFELKKYNPIDFRNSDMTKLDNHDLYENCIFCILRKNTELKKKAKMCEHIQFGVVLKHNNLLIYFKDTSNLDVDSCMNPISIFKIPKEWELGKKIHFQLNYQNVLGKRVLILQINDHYMIVERLKTYNIESRNTYIHVTWMKKTHGDDVYKILTTYIRSSLTNVMVSEGINGVKRSNIYVDIGNWSEDIFLFMGATHHLYNKEKKNHIKPEYQIKYEQFQFHTLKKHKKSEMSHKYTDKIDKKQWGNNDRKRKSENDSHDKPPNKYCYCDKTLYGCHKSNKKHKNVGGILTPYRYKTSECNSKSSTSTFIRHRKNKHPHKNGKCGSENDIEQDDSDDCKCDSETSTPTLPHHEHTQDHENCHIKQNCRKNYALKDKPDSKCYIPLFVSYERNSETPLILKNCVMNLKIKEPMERELLLGVDYNVYDNFEKNSTVYGEIEKHMFLIPGRHSMVHELILVIENCQSKNHNNNFEELQYNFKCSKSWLNNNAMLDEIVNGRIKKHQYNHLNMYTPNNYEMLTQTFEAYNTANKWTITFHLIGPNSFSSEEIAHYSMTGYSNVYDGRNATDGLLPRPFTETNELIFKPLPVITDSILYGSKQNMFKIKIRKIGGDYIEVNPFVLIKEPTVYNNPQNYILDQDSLYNLYVKDFSPKKIELRGNLWISILQYSPSQHRSKEDALLCGTCNWNILKTQHFYIAVENGIGLCDGSSSIEHTYEGHDYYENRYGGLPIQNDIFSSETHAWSSKNVMYSQNSKTSLIFDENSQSFTYNTIWSKCRRNYLFGPLRIHQCIKVKVKHSTLDRWKFLDGISKNIIDGGSLQNVKEVKICVNKKGETEVIPLESELEIIDKYFTPFNESNCSQNTTGNASQTCSKLDQSITWKHLHPYLTERNKQSTTSVNGIFAMNITTQEKLELLNENYVLESIFCDGNKTNPHNPPHNPCIYDRCGRCNGDNSTCGFLDPNNCPPEMLKDSQCILDRTRCLIDGPFGIGIPHASISNSHVEKVFVDLEQILMWNYTIKAQVLLNQNITNQKVNMMWKCLNDSFIPNYQVFMEKLINGTVTMHHMHHTNNSHSGISSSDEYDEYCSKNNGTKPKHFICKQPSCAKHGKYVRAMIYQTVPLHALYRCYTGKNASEITLDNIQEKLGFIESMLSLRVLSSEKEICAKSKHKHGEHQKCKHKYKTLLETPCKFKIYNNFIDGKGVCQVPPSNSHNKTQQSVNINVFSSFNNMDSCVTTKKKREWFNNDDFFVKFVTCSPYYNLKNQSFGNSNKTWNNYNEYNYTLDLQEIKILHQHGPGLQLVNGGISPFFNPPTKIITQFKNGNTRQCHTWKLKTKNNYFLYKKRLINDVYMKFVFKKKYYNQDSNENIETKVLLWKIVKLDIYHDSNYKKIIGPTITINHLYPKCDPIDQKDYDFEICLFKNRMLTKRVNRFYRNRRIWTTLSLKPKNTPSVCGMVNNYCFNQTTCGDTYKTVLNVDYAEVCIPKVVIHSPNGNHISNVALHNNSFCNEDNGYVYTILNLKSPYPYKGGETWQTTIEKIDGCETNYLISFVMRSICPQWLSNPIFIRFDRYAEFVKLKESHGHNNDNNYHHKNFLGYERDYMQNNKKKYTSSNTELYLKCGVDEHYDNYIWMNCVSSEYYYFSWIIYKIKLPLIALAITLILGIFMCIFKCYGAKHDELVDIKKKDDDYLENERDSKNKKKDDEYRLKKHAVFCRFETIGIRNTNCDSCMEDVSTETYNDFKKNDNTQPRGYNVRW